MKALTPFRVGLLLLASAAFLFLFLSFVKKGGLSADESTLVYAYFSDASGLGKKSRVQIAGITVGEVAEITLEGTRAKVWLKIQEEIPLKVNAELTKRSESLLGDYMLDLNPGTDDAAPMPQGGQIRIVHDTQALEAVMQSAEKITKNVEQVTAALNRVLGGEKGEASLEQIVNSMVELSTNVNATVENTARQLEDILRNFQAVSNDVREITQGQDRNVNQILVNIEAITRDTRDVLGTVKQIVGTGEGDFKESVASLKQTLNTLEASLKNVEEITAKVKRGEGAAGALLTDDRLGQKISEAVEDVSNLASTITGLQTEVGVKSEYLLSQGSAKNFLQLRLITKPDKYYLLEIVDDPRGSVETQVVQSNPPATGEPVTQVQKITRDSLKVSAMFAKRYYFTTLRFGLIESTGGIGADLHLLEDHLTLKVDAFNFSVENLAYPRLRATLRLQAFDHLFATAGVDDVFNVPQRDLATRRLIAGRDYFFGAGIYFTDDDLKSLITIVGLPTP